MEQDRDRHLRTYLDRQRVAEAQGEGQGDTARFPTVEAPARVIVADRPTCGEPHGRVCLRMDHLEATSADHETRLRTQEAARGAVAGKFVWVLVTTFVTCAISAFVGLLIARAAGG
jgi:hypothetical protein